MICPNCGKELEEGQVCTCATEQNESQNEATVNQTSVNNNDYEQNYQEPENNSEYTQNYQEPVQPDAGYYNPNPNQYYYVDPNQQQQYYMPNIEPSTDYPEGYKPKKKYVAVILGYALGVFGIHNFYLGNSSRGLAQVLLSTIGCILFGLGPVAALIWSLVETTLILTDKIDADANNYKIMTFAEELAKANKKANE